MSGTTASFFGIKCMGENSPGRALPPHDPTQLLPIAKYSLFPHVTTRFPTTLCSQVLTWPTSVTSGGGTLVTCNRHERHLIRRACCFSPYYCPIAARHLPYDPLRSSTANSFKISTTVLRDPNTNFACKCSHL